MSTNFLQFDTNKQNLMADEVYDLSLQRANGVPLANIADPLLHNKMYYQWSTFVAAYAKVFSDLGETVSDDDLAALNTVLAKTLTTYGGTLQNGQTIVLGRQPVGSMDAATKQYVDTSLPTSAYIVTQTFGQNSYRIWSNGFIEQWRRGPGTHGDEVRITVSFPMAFPNAVTNIQVADYCPDAGHTSNQWWQIYAYSLSSVSMICQSANYWGGTHNPMIYASGY